MADFENLEKEACLFAEDFFSDILSLHPMFRVQLPEHSPTPAKSSHFTRAVSKSVMVFWQKLRNTLTIRFRKDFNSFSKGDAALKLYLEHLCDAVREFTTCKMYQVLGLSAVLLELIAILYRRGYTFFLSHAPIYWLSMFKNIAFDGFYKGGGWEGLTVLSKEFEIDYDNREIEIYWEYWDSDKMPWAQSDQRNEKGYNLTEALSSIVTDFSSSSVIAVKAELDTVSEDKIGTDFESEKPSKDPIIPKTLEPTKQFSKEMTSKDEKAKKDFNEQGKKRAISESRETQLGKKDTDNVSPRPEDLSKKATVSESVSSMSRSSTAQIDKKFRMPHVVPKGSDSNPKISKRITPKKESSSKIIKDSISQAPKQGKSLKIDCAAVRSTATAPKSEKMVKATSIKSPSPKVVATSPSKKAVTTSPSPKAVTTSTRVPKSAQALPGGQSATSTVTSASGQNVSQDVDATKPGDLNTSAKEKSTKKGAPGGSGQKQTSVKKNPTPRRDWRQ